MQGAPMSIIQSHFFRCAVLGLLLATAANAHDTDGFRGPALLDEDLPGWDADNRERLNNLLTDYRVKRGGARRPVAVFDWDNTVVKNDIGDATFFWMIQHDKI